MKKTIEVEYPDVGSVWKYSPVNYENNAGFFICSEGTEMKSIEGAEFSDTIQPTTIADFFGEIGHRGSRIFSPHRDWSFYAKNKIEFMQKQAVYLTNKNQIKVDKMAELLKNIIECQEKLHEK